MKRLWTSAWRTTTLLVALCCLAITTSACGLAEPGQQTVVERASTDKVVHDASLQWLQMTSAYNGWAIRSKSVYHMAGSKRLWQRVTNANLQVSAPGSPYQPAPLAVLGPERAWLVANQHSTGQVLLRTHDGGSHWQPVGMPPGQVVGLSMINDELGWLLQGKGGTWPLASGRLLATTNGGRSWQEIGRFGTTNQAKKRTSLPLVGQLTGLQVMDDGTGWLTSTPAGAGQLALTTTHDKGRHWKLQQLPLPSHLPPGHQAASERYTTYTPLTFGDRDILPVTTSSHLFIVYGTVNRGLKWQAWAALALAGPAVWTFTGHYGWVTGGSDLYFTTDGGQSWQRLAAKLPPGRPFSMTFANEQVGWLLEQQDSGIVRYRTADGGKTWARSPLVIDSSQ